MSSPSARRKVWDYAPEDEGPVDREDGKSVPSSPTNDRPVPARTGSRNSDKRGQTSRHNSRNNVPTLNMPYQFHERRNHSSGSLDSEALLHDHRQLPQSLPRSSFLMPKPNGGRRKNSHRNSVAPRKARKSTLGRTQEAPESSDSDDTDSSDERTGLIAKQKKTRRQSSSQQSIGQKRRDSDYGAVDHGDNLSPPNPNYPPSIPSSFGSRRNSQEVPSGRIRDSIAGRDESGAPVRVTMAQRVLDYAHRRASNVGQDDAPQSDMSQLPDTISTSPPNSYDDLEDSNATEDEGRDRNRMHSRAAEDVCFPLSDEVGVHGHIDFDELAEWSRSQIEEKEDTEGNGTEWRHRKLSEPMLVNGKYRNRGGWLSYERDDEDNRPFRFTFFSDDLQSTVHSPTLYELPQEDQSFQDLFGTDKTWWLDVNSPTDSEMKVLSSAFGIHPLTAEDISMEEQREKVELFRNYYLVSFRSFQQDPNSDDYLEPVNMYIVVFKDGVLSFHFNSTPHPANVRRRIRQLRDYITVSSDWISYALIDDIVDAFSPLIQRIEYEVDTIDENVLGIDIDSETSDSEQSNMLRRIGACRKKVMGLLRLLGSKADVVKGFAKRCNEHWDVAPRSEIGLYLGDIQDHIVTMVQNLNHYEKILSRSHSNYLAQISIEMTKVNNDTNDVLSRLTVLGTMLIPMNLITGLFGINVKVPGQDVDSLQWFFGIVGFMCAFFALIYILGRARGLV